MVPGKFTLKERAKARRYILNRVSKCHIKKDGSVAGDFRVTYEELANHLKYTIENQYDAYHMGTLCGNLSEEEYYAGGPLISAVVVDAKDKLPGEGFFKLAMDYGEFRQSFRINRKGIDEASFFIDQINKIVAKYGK